jgi:hypothetical protein
MKNGWASLAILCCIALNTTNAYSQTIVKNIGNGISFTVTSCTADSGSQRVVLSFKFSNPNKPDQKILIVEPAVPGHEIAAYDENSKIYPCTKIDVGGKTIQARPVYMKFMARIVNGLSLGGSFTFDNIPLGTKTLALVTIYEKSSNWDNGGDQNSGVIQVKNVPIVWSNTGN